MSFLPRSLSNKHTITLGSSFMQKLVFFSKHLLLRYVIGVIICAFSVSVYIAHPKILNDLDLATYDSYLKLNGGGTPSPVPAIIDIDEKSLAQIGQWPWPRHVLVRLIENLTEAGAASIGFDILLSEPDRTSPIHIKESLQKDFDAKMSFTGLPEFLHDNDTYFAGILEQTPSVLGMYINFQNEQTEVDEKSKKQVKALPRLEGFMERIPKELSDTKSILPANTHVLKGQGVTLPLSMFTEKEVPVGAINVAPDADGVIRSVPLIMQVEGRYFVSLSLRALMRGMGIRTLALESSIDGLSTIHLGKYAIPVTPAGFFRVPFRGPKGVYPYFSAVDILEKRIPVEELQGRVFLIGTSAPGLLDIRATPFDNIYPGVEVHASTMDAILSKRTITIPNWIHGAQIVAICVLGIFCILMFSLGSPLIYIPMFALISSGILSFTWYLFKQSMFMSPTYMLFTVIFLMISLLAVRFWQESKSKKQLRQAFSRYVAPEMVAKIVERGEAVLAGEEREISLMFTDIRGFTGISEKLSPSQMVSLLNDYFTPMTAIIRKNAGTVDKFIGDAIMAFWNAPLNVEQHELKSVISAITMQKVLSIMNKDLEQKYAIQLAMGVGIHTGNAYVGNMGSDELLNYTCIGDAVNLSSRLEGLCPVYGVPVVVSSVTAEHCQQYEQEIPLKSTASTKAFSTTQEHIKYLIANMDAQPVPVFIELDFMRVKGKKEPISIFTPILQEDYKANEKEWTAFTTAHNFYKDAQFEKAIEEFKALNELYPHRLLHDLFHKRSIILKEDSPPDWDGVWTFTSK